MLGCLAKNDLGEVVNVVQFLQGSKHVTVDFSGLMATSADLYAEALALEDALRLAAQVKLQQAKSKGDRAALLGQQTGEMTLFAWNREVVKTSSDQLLLVWWDIAADSS